MLTDAEHSLDQGLINADIPVPFKRKNFWPRII